MARQSRFTHRLWFTSVTATKYQGEAARPFAMPMHKRVRHGAAEEDQTKRTMMVARRLSGMAGFWINDNESWTRFHTVSLKTMRGACVDARGWTASCWKRRRSNCSLQCHRTDNEKAEQQSCLIQCRTNSWTLDSQRHVQRFNI